MHMQYCNVNTSRVIEMTIHGLCPHQLGLDLLATANQM
jgi:hypothetical protein